MGGGGEDVQVIVQFNLINLGVGQSGPEAAPVGSKVGAGVNTIIGSDIERAGHGGAVDLDRPHRQIGKGAGSRAADIGPCRPTISRAENVAVSTELVDHRVCNLRVGGIRLYIIDPRAARWEVMLRPRGAMASRNENLAAGCERATRSGIDCVHI